MSLKQDCARHDLQARRGCRKKLASPQWPQPVAENHPRHKIHRRNRGCQIASSNRCRLIPLSPRFGDSSERDIEKVWTAVALHTTPGIPEHMHPEIALVQAGAGMDVVGRGYDHFTDDQREAVIAAYPRGNDFKHEIIEAFYHGMKHRPDSTFGTFNDDFLAFKDPDFQRGNLCSIILGSRWER